LVGTEIWLDPTEEEARSAMGTMVLSCMPALETVNSVWQTGSMTPGDALAVSYAQQTSIMTEKFVFQCINSCRTRCNDIHAVVAQALLERV
jgi:exosome complex component MTR3